MLLLKSSELRFFFLISLILHANMFVSALDLIFDPVVALEPNICFLVISFREKIPDFLNDTLCSNCITLISVFYKLV